MKRLLSAVLCLIVLIASTACSNDFLTLDTLDFPKESFTVDSSVPEVKEPESKDGVFERNGFSTGYARVDITPSNSVILGGFPNAHLRYSKRVADRLYVSCVAISDGEKIALFFSYDNLNVQTYFRNQVAKLVEKDLGVPKELVWITATHSHHAPMLGSSSNNSIIRHLTELYPAFRQCAKRAVETLDQSEIYIGKTETVGLNYVRRYVSVLDGSWVGGNDTPSNSDPAKVRHESIADPEMQIIKFDRKNAKDIVMVNWQSHYTGAGLENEEISASWVAGFREKAEKELGVDFAFYQGAAGNVVVGSKLKGENSGRNYMTQGHLLADALISGMGSLKKIEPGKISGVIKMETVTYNKDTEGFDLNIAKQISELYATDTVAASRLVSQYGFDSYFHAHYMYRRSQYEADTRDIEICAIRIGSIGFASAPYEMFHENGSQVKEGSPYEMTFMCAYTNGSHGYIPARASFPNRGYEVVSCYFVPGTGEQVANSLLELLNGLNG